MQQRNHERAPYGAETDEEKGMVWSLRHQEKERGPMRARGEKEGCCEDAESQKPLTDGEARGCLLPEMSKNRIKKKSTDAQ